MDLRNGAEPGEAAGANSIRNASSDDDDRRPDDEVEMDDEEYAKHWQRPTQVQQRLNQMAAEQLRAPQVPAQ